MANLFREQLEEMLAIAAALVGAKASAVAQVTASPSVATTSVQVIGSNPNRKAFILYNNSANSAYITFGPTSVSSACSFLLPTYNQSFPLPFIAYTGPISAIRNSGTGSIIVTEFV